MRAPNWCEIYSRLLVTRSYPFLLESLYSPKPHGQGYDFSHHRWSPTLMRNINKSSFEAHTLDEIPLMGPPPSGYLLYGKNFEPVQRPSYPCRIESPSYLQPLNLRLKFPSSSMVTILDPMRKYPRHLPYFNVHFQDFRPQIHQGVPSFMKIILSTQHCSSSPSNSSGWRRYQLKISSLLVHNHFYVPAI